MTDVNVRKTKRHHLFGRTVPRRTTVLEELANGAPATTHRIAKLLGLSRGAAYALLATMAEDGLLLRRQDGSKKSLVWVGRRPPPTLPLPTPDGERVETAFASVPDAELDAAFAPEPEPEPSVDDLEALRTYLQRFRLQHPELTVAVTVTRTVVSTEEL